MKCAMLIVGTLGLWAGMALAEESADASAESPAAEAKDESKAVAIAKATAEKKFNLPPGFYEKKHGKYTLYCKKDAPMGTRLKSERCMNDIQMRDYLLALEQQKTDIDRIRAVCSNPEICAPP